MGVADDRLIHVGPIGRGKDEGRAGQVIRAIRAADTVHFRRQFVAKGRGHAPDPARPRLDQPPRLTRGDGTAADD